MFAFVIVACGALSSAHAGGLSQKINDLHLHAKLGESLSEYKLATKQLNLVDQYVSQVAEKFVTVHIGKDPTLFKTMYGPIENVVIPGIKLTRPINLTNIRITGLRRLKLNGLQWRMGSNKVTCNASLPFLLVEVTFDNVHIELDDNFGNEELLTSIRLSFRLLDLEISTSARYNVQAMPIAPNLFIDKAEVDLTAREVLVEINVQQGLEEFRYVLAELMNNSLEDIMDSVLSMAVEEINKELLGKVDPNQVTNYLISRVPRNSKVPKELIVINGV